MQEEIHFKGKLVCLWHMSADKIITTKPTGLKLTFCPPPPPQIEGDPKSPILYIYLENEAFSHLRVSVKHVRSDTFCLVFRFAEILSKVLVAREKSLYFTYGRPEESCSSFTLMYFGKRRASRINLFWSR